jgi:hypothetical protein
LTSNCGYNTWDQCVASVQGLSTMFCSENPWYHMRPGDPTYMRPDDWQPNRIRTEYVPPTNPEHQRLYELLKERQSLEKLQEIFSPIRLRADLTLKTVNCGMVNAWYQRPTLTICYEYLADILNTASKEKTPAGITREDAVVGQFFYVVAHEMGHAMFDQLSVPLFGREEDAADQFAAYMMLRIGKEDARRLIGGAAYTYHNFVKNPTMTLPITAFSDVHGASMQRLYNLLCIAYGADSEGFSDIVDKGVLPQNRAKNCSRE